MTTATSATQPATTPTLAPAASAATAAATAAPQAGSPEANKALMRRFVEEFQTAARSEVADELLAPDFVDHSLLPGFAAGPQGVKQLFASLHAALPDFQATIHDQVAEGDKVVTRKTFSGTHRGELMGVPPTGKHVAFTVIDIVRLRGGQIAEHWNLVDLLGLLRQLGAVPA
jgi:steroid delta-isomerase-like uncharacterized protein